MPPRTPAPASHMVKPSTWWSRPSADWPMGCRPNSPPKGTNVSFSNPRRSRSVSSAPTGWSTALHPRTTSRRRLEWRSQPVEVTSTNRTPDSTDSLLHQQIELIGPEAVSLDSLWRAAGCPPEQSPRRWTVLAAPLIAGFVRYFTSLPERLGDIDDERPLPWVWDGEE